MKITLIIPSLSCGGAERVLVSMAKGFIQREHQVTIITLSEKDSDFYELPPECSRIGLGIMGNSVGVTEALRNNVKRVTVLRRAILTTAPDVIISFLRITNITTILASLGTNLPLIVTEHNDLSAFSYGSLWENLRRFTYPLATGIVSVSKGVDRGFADISEQKRAVVYNPILVDDAGSFDELPPEADLQKKWLVSMGRLTQQKRFDLLLQAFSKIAHQYPDWQLIIMGKGELQEELSELKSKLNLSDRVVFTGALSNPFTVLRQGEIFVMSSENEGFPMAHGEALACGLPVVCTDCPSGPREMIRQDVDGLLVPNRDTDALAAAMADLMSDESRRQQLAAKAPEVLDRFGLEAIVAEWEILIQRLLKG